MAISPELGEILCLSLRFNFVLNVLIFLPLNGESDYLVIARVRTMLGGNAEGG